MLEPKHVSMLMACKYAGVSLQPTGERSWAVGHYTHVNLNPGHSPLVLMKWLSGASRNLMGRPTAVVILISLFV